jgi:uncharacterized protein YceH (UPF0502 family)
MQELNSVEIRVVGCLIEKAVTTPEQYPLSLNSLTNACNQKSNREPVLELSEIEVQEALDSLIDKNLAAEVRFGGRIPKYQHRFGTSEFAEVRYNSRELAVLCLLFLRGMQTPGELRNRSARLANFADVTEVDAILEKLATHPAGPFVQKLEREPGKRENRWAHLFSGELKLPSPSTSSTSHYASSAQLGSGLRSSENQSTLSQLSERVRLLEEELLDIKQAFDQLKAQFDELMS